MKNFRIESRALVPLVGPIMCLLALCAGPATLADELSAAENAIRAQEILEHRCMVCHGCYDAPCQLKMEAHAGLRRGANKDLIYDASRLRQAELTRLFDDAHTERRWRKKGFYPVLDDKDPTEGTMYRMLQLKQAHPLDTKGPMPEGFDFSLARDQQCPKPEEFDKYRRDYPLWGMPYGLPGLNSDNHEILTTWLEQGAPRVPMNLLTNTERKYIERWETFLNGGDNKHQLMARYVYEHLFLASLYFEESDDPTWFRLVRSRTPPGKPLEVIATRRPYDDPGTKKFYYRLQRWDVTPLRKIHMPYRFDQQRMDWYTDLFLEPKYEIDKLPGYGGENNTNPFFVYVDIPVRSRYDFLLQEAQFTIMNFIKGPVCRGRVALSVIEEQFWVMFEDPDLLDEEWDQMFLARESTNLRLPQSRTGSVVDLLSWRKYSRAQTEYLRAKAEFAAKAMEHRPDLRIDYPVIWTGDGNPNAALTVFRHFDTATVVKGFVGDIPKTAWVIDYPLLERIHYLLVAGFDVFGSVSHQVESRLYMDFLRLEGEVGFLSFMPKETRRELNAYWYRDASTGIQEHLEKANISQVAPTSIIYKTDDPKREFLETMRERISGAADHRYDPSVTADPKTLESFAQLEKSVGQHNSFMPNVSFVNVVGDRSDEVYTIIRNSGYSNIAQMFSEDKRRLPDEDSLTIVSGFIGAYPNQFFQLNEKEVATFAQDILALGSKDDYKNLIKRFGVARNASWFWRISDKMHLMQARDGPIDSGLFDYGRYRAY